MAKPIRILIVDDHSIVSAGITALLSSEPDFEVLATLSDSKDTARFVAFLKPDVILLDFNMPGMNGLEVTHQLILNFPDVKILILSIYNEQRHVRDFKKAGARGYLLKSADKQVLAEAIRNVNNGKTVFNQHDRNALKHTIHSNDDFLKKLLITRRQRDIIEKIMDGLNNQKIADALYISINTVETQKKEIYRKLGVKNNVELVNLMRKIL